MADYQQATQSAYLGEGAMQATGNVIAPPSEREFNRIRALMIRQVDHGYFVEVGCQTFAIEKASDLIAKLSEYILSPADTEKKWQEGKLF